jgi:hypothetical protein
MILFLIAIAILVGSCVTTTRSIQRTPGADPFDFIRTNGTNKHPTVIRLHNIDDRFFCTGAVIDGQYALTAAHCVTDSLGTMKTENIKIHDAYGNYITDALPIAIDKYLDVAFIKGAFEDFEVKEVDFAGKHSFLGMHLLSCGFPAGQFDLYCTELIHVGNYYFQYNTIGGPIYHGMSGGPVIETVSGAIVGVNSAVDDNSVVISPLIGALESTGLN